MNIQQPPVLDHDLLMKQRHNYDVHASGKLERRIVFNLCLHLQAAGFNLVSVWDGEDNTPVKTPKDAMELIFNLDEASLRVRKDGFKTHGILLIVGEGDTIITDWNYTEGDPDGFSAAMDAFDAEACH